LKDEFLASLSQVREHQDCGLADTSSDRDRFPVRVRRFAHIVLRYRETLVCVRVTPDCPARLPSESAIDGTRVSSFRAVRFAAFVVSSAADTETREIAAGVAGPMKNALGGG